METQILQIEITKKLQQIFNEIYKTYSGDTNDFYKFATICDYNFDQFRYYNENGELVVDNYNFADRYVACIVESIMGERRPIPNTYVADVTIPLTLYVSLDDLDLTYIILEKFTSEIIGKVYSFGLSDGLEVSNYNLTILSNIPDFGSFVINQGENQKEITFELVGTITSNVLYGNNIKYYLKTSNQAEYTEIVKIEPSTLRAKTIYTDQVIGEKYTKSLVQTSTWEKSFSFLFQENELCYNLLRECEGVATYEYTLKIVYDLPNFIMSNSVNYVEKNVLLEQVSYSDDIGNFMTFSVSFKDKF